MPTSLIDEQFQSSHRSRTFQVREPVVVAVLAAYPSVRAGLASLMQMDESIRPTSVRFQSLLAPESVSTALPQATDIVLVDSGDIPRDALLALINLTRGEELPLLWVGVPTVDIQDKSVVSVVAQDVDSTTLIAAIHAMAAGLTVTDPSLAWQQTNSEPRRLDVYSEAGPLSPREQEVLQLVAAGLPNKAIARELGISDHTVKFHVSSLLSKLDAGSRTEAVTVATRRGLLFL